MSNTYFNALGESYLFSGVINPSVTAVDALKGTLFIYTPTVGASGLYQKQDDGLTTNWVLVSSGGGGMDLDFSNAMASAVDIDLGGNNIVDLADPINAQDAATKNYVDTQIASVQGTKVEYFTLTNTDITNQYVTLSNVPSNPTNVGLDVKGGGAQFEGDDFQMSGNQLQFLNDLATGGAAELVAGDRLRVIYS